MGRRPGRRATAATSSRYAAAVAATLALPAADLCANLNIQVHGGIGFTWEHDAHLYLRRATALGPVLDAEAAADDVTDLVRDGRRRASAPSTSRPRPRRSATRSAPFADRVKDLDDDGPASSTLIDTGYVHAALAHAVGPGRRRRSSSSSSSRSSRAAGVKRPAYGITGWVILTLIQHGTDDQVARWVRAGADARRSIWCQLFSEPDAGSDAAGVKTKATRVDGGWLVNGQKVWTSRRPLARASGFATVRTNPDVTKHDGITTMVIDMHAEGVEVRPLQDDRRRRRSSTRSSSTTCSSPTTTWSARSTAAGPSPAPPSATRA